MDKKWIKWIKAAAIRAIRTFFQIFGSFITVGATLNEVSWGYMFSVSTVAAIYSLATSLAGLPEVKEDEDILTGNENGEEANNV